MTARHTALSEPDDIERRIDTAERLLCVTFLPWQRDYLRAIHEPERAVILGCGRRNGMATIRRAQGLKR